MTHPHSRFILKTSLPKFPLKYILLHVKMNEQPVRIFIIKYGRSNH